jgi:hypothetical protein
MSWHPIDSDSAAAASAPISPRPVRELMDRIVRAERDGVNRRAAVAVAGNASGTPASARSGTGGLDLIPPCGGAAGDAR